MAKPLGVGAVQRLLIVLCCVRWDFGGIFRASAPLGTQQSHQKIPSPKKGICSTYDDPHTKKRWYLPSKPPTTGNLGGNEEIPQWWDGISHIIPYDTRHKHHAEYLCNFTRKQYIGQMSNLNSYLFL
jgi:hypothetical protein